MTDQKQNRTLSKIIAYMLGKAPEEFGLLPDEEGFVKIKELLQALHEEEGWRHVRSATLNELAITLPDVSFEIRDNRIRARQRSGLTPPVACREAPRCLYTCVRERAYTHVLQKGISPTVHSRVVLCADQELAEKIGRRRSPDPITLTVHTGKAEQQGIIFYQSGEKLFFADYIPEGCFSGPALPREKEIKETKPRFTDSEGIPAEGTRNRAGAFLITPLPGTDGADGRNKKKKRETDWKLERKRLNWRGHKRWPDS